jgi:shikimate kinase/3-dehydroquinate synthase
MTHYNIILLGPPGSGKSTIGRQLATSLGWQFVDVDTYIGSQQGVSIAEIFAQQGESAFRNLEQSAIATLSQQTGLVIAPGGGALLHPANRQALQKSGVLIGLHAPAALLWERIQNDPTERPLVKAGFAELERLLAARQPLYDALPNPIDTSLLTPSAAVAAIRDLLPRCWQVKMPGSTLQGQQYPVWVGNGLFQYLPRLLTPAQRANIRLVVSDSNVAPLWGATLAETLTVPLVVVPAGEAHKSIESATRLYGEFLQHGLDRKSVVLAVGGGVIGDLVGFVAATYMRGIDWVNVPSTLLAMVDASIGGKVGIDLPQGKNLVGAFHPPLAVLTDPDLLQTLPAVEYRSGLAEVIKHAVIADPGLLDLLPAHPNLVARAAAVKIDVVQRDPYENGERANLNLGHTIGHGLEAASTFALRHGEAVSLGMMAAAWLAVQLEIALPELQTQIGQALQRVGLPTHLRDTGLQLDVQQVRALMQNDKKKVGKQLTFALPERLGNMRFGVAVPDDLILAAIQQLL